MRVMVTGASGFIASAVIQKLKARNYEVVPIYRSQKSIGHRGGICDFKKLLSMDDWLPLVSGIDIVINCAGILRENNKGDFQKVHCQAPTALLNACEQVGVKRFIQISALGHPEDADFIQSKHAFDEKGVLSLND